MAEAIPWASLLFSAAAAILGAVAALTPVRDNIDAFIGDLHTQGRWAGLAAAAAGIAVLLQVVERFITPSSFG